MLGAELEGLGMRGGSMAVDWGGHRETEIYSRAILMVVESPVHRIGPSLCKEEMDSGG